jgi:translation initiation factor 4E
MRRGKATKTDEGMPAAEAAAAATETPNPYENSIKLISTIQTVEDFWSTYNFLRRPNDLPTTTDYHFFREGIKPTWEDSSNAKGGKWIVRLPKGLASRYWEEGILALIGGQFPGVPDGEICGIVVSIRYSEDILGIWNKTSHDSVLVDRLRDAIKKVLQLPSYAPLEYKPHQNSIQDKSSFRNTHAWKSKSSEARNNNSSSDRETRRQARRGGGDSDRAWR